jgi:hypothetical protein
MEVNLDVPIDGFWLPQDIHRQLIGENTAYTSLAFANGRPSQPGAPGSVSARWPVFSPEQWEFLLQALQQNRQRAPQGLAYWQRLQQALQQVSQLFAQPDYPPRRQALQSLPTYTGYSEPMIRLTLNALDMFALEQMPAGFRLQLDQRASEDWQKMPGLPGMVRFYSAGGWSNAFKRLPGLGRRALFTACPFPEQVVGYSAGNVPGAALLIAFLSQATTLAGGQPPPATVIRNSRREPIFSPLILDAIQSVDPDLVASIAVLVWDYEESALQERLLSQAHLVVAAASDETIAQLQSQIEGAQARRSYPVPTRFHAHGHKVSFSAIGKEVLRRDQTHVYHSLSLLDVMTLLAALDSIFWDQHGCLSSRVHFVEAGDVQCFSALEYAEQLKQQLTLLAQYMPRGAWPRQQLHDRFDRYKQLEATGQVQVLSNYQDDFLVIVDRRNLSPRAFYSLVNDCQGRVIVVRPVENLMQIPRQFLRLLPPVNLQSLSVAVGASGSSMSEEFLAFAHACGQCGVTAIRTVGRGAFPQLSYSWDGLMPQDLVSQRPAGYFTTIEFDRPYDQILETYDVMQQRGAMLGLLG